MCTVGLSAGLVSDMVPLVALVFTGNAPSLQRVTVWLSYPSNAHFPRTQVLRSSLPPQWWLSRMCGGWEGCRLGDQGRLCRLPLFAWDIQVAYPLAGVCSQNKIPLSLWKETLATGPECGQAVWIICLATYGAFERDEFQKTFTPAG